MRSDVGRPNSNLNRPLWGALFNLLVGPLVWALHLTVVYVAHAILCARGYSAFIPPLVVAAATIAALAVLICCLRQLRGAAPGDATPEHRFRSGVSMALIGLSIVGIAWAGATIVFVPGCLTLR
jgi:hypothetical protein